MRTLINYTKKKNKKRDLIPIETLKPSVMLYP